MFAFLRPNRSKTPVAPKSATRRRTPVLSNPRLMALTAVPVPVEVRVSARSRRLSMRVDQVRNVVRISTPPQVSDADIQRFIGRHLEWLQQRLSAIPPRFAFQDGALVPILGVEYRICHRPNQRLATRLTVEDGQSVLLVGGDPAFLNRRVSDFLKAEARRQLAERARVKAAALGAKVAGISVRDTRSRWGSCSASGRLSFCWRLILAPDAVFDYVVAHEVAHLKEMNHSQRFWELCASLTPAVEAPREWLRVNGARLHAYG